MGSNHANRSFTLNAVPSRLSRTAARGLCVLGLVALPAWLGCSSTITSTSPGSGGSGAGTGGSRQGAGSGGTVGGSGGLTAASGGSGSGGATQSGGGGGGTGNAGSSGGAGRAAGGVAGGTSDGGTPDSMVACPGAGQSLHFQDDLNGTRTTSTQVLADLGTDLPIGNTARTIEMWLYMEGNESWKAGHSIVEYGGVGRCNAFGIDGGDTGIANPAQFDPFTFSAGSTCAGDNNVAITPAPPRTGWLHVAYAYDPAGIGGVANVNFVFTVNGVAQPITGARQTGPLLTMQTMLSIGSGQDASADTGQGFTGRIDEFRVWNVGRTAQEILDNHRLILRGDEPGLVAYYHFDEGMGTTVMDASTRRHNALFAANNARPAPTWVASAGLTLTCKP
jgi:hypothetical protein